MKKILALLLCVVFAVSLCACDKEKDSKKEKKASTSESSAAETSKPDETKAPDETKEPTTTTDPSLVSGGKIENGTYKFATGGISIKVPSGWTSSEIMMMTVLAKDPTAEDVDCGVIFMAMTKELTDGKEVKFSDIVNNPAAFSETMQVEDGVKFEKVKVGGKDALYYTETEEGMMSKGYILDGKIPVVFVVTYKESAKAQADSIIASVKYTD